MVDHGWSPAEAQASRVTRRNHLNTAPTLSRREQREEFTQEAPMRLSIADVEADSSLPGWMLDERFPDWSRDTKYRHITEGDYCVALMEVRRGWRDQSAFDKLIFSRKSTTKARAKKKAERDALPAEVKAAQELRLRQKQRLAQLTSAVTMRKRMLDEAIAKYGEHDGLMVHSERQHLQWAREALSRHVTAAIAEELRQRACALQGNARLILPSRSCL
jgi:hypothetical protein